MYFCLCCQLTNVSCIDSRYLRNIGIPAYGISPIHSTPTLLHDHNEFLNESVFLEGIGWYTSVIERLGNLPEH
jgi:aminoacylase